jgi:hypothetical protein
MLQKHRSPYSNHHKDNHHLNKAQRRLSIMDTTHMQESLQETWQKQVQAVHTPGRTVFVCPNQPILIKLPWNIDRCSRYHIRRTVPDEKSAQEIVRKFGTFLQLQLAEQRNAFLVIEPPQLTFTHASLELICFAKVFRRAVSLDDSGRPAKRVRRR